MGLVTPVTEIKLFDKIGVGQVMEMTDDFIVFYHGDKNISAYTLQHFLDHGWEKYGEPLYRKTDCGYHMEYFYYFKKVKK